MAKFEKGNKAAVGRKENGQGRPNKQQMETKRLAAAHALKYLETHYLKGAADAMGMLASGKGPRGGKTPAWLKRVHPNSVHALIAKFIPDAPRRIDLGLADTMEDFVDQVMSGKVYEGMNEDEEDAEIVGGKPAIEDKTEEPK